MLKGKTKSGFTYQISEERLNNYELLELFGEMEDDATKLPQVIRLLLGKDLAAKLKDHVRDADGLVPADKMGEEIQEILDSQNQVKKS